MEKSFFLKKIEESYRKYGKDSWIFLRELAQNSRDSGAGEIRIDLGGFGENREVIIFSDNGRGMTLKEAKNHLFRLYSSSKSGEKYSLGMYGIGFWSVMSFSPAEIIVESYSEEEEKWGLKVKSDLEYETIDCRLTKYGTRVTLIRESSFGDFKEFSRVVKEGVIRYCSHLEHPEKSGENIQVVFQGEHISKGLTGSSAISLKYSGREYEGVVSLDSEPKVSLFAGGIPVWEGTSIDELTLINGKSGSSVNYIDSGIAPVFKINGRGLKVNMDRRKPIYNRSLKKVLGQSQKALERLVHAYLDYAYPGKFLDRISFKIRKLFSSVRISYWKIILLSLLIIVPVEFVILNSIFNEKKIESSSKKSEILLKTNGFKHYRSTVDKIGKNVIADIEYSPGVNIRFKMFTASGYGRGTGFVRVGKDMSPSESNLINRVGKSFLINIKIRRGGEIFLPVPDGYGVDPASVLLGGEPLDSIQLLNKGETTVLNVKSGKSVRYIAFPLKNQQKLSKRDIAFYQRVPRSVIFPEKINRILMKSAKRPVHERVSICRKLTNILLYYDNSDETVNYFKFSAGNDNWLKKVLDIGAGDCDVINGLNALLLRRVGVPSRLVVGLKGEKGRMAPNLHAWTEYYDGVWREIDATVTSSVLHDDLSPGDDFYKERFFKSSGIKRGVGVTEILFFLVIVLIIPLTLVIRNRKKSLTDISKGFEFRNRSEVRRDIAMIVRSYLLNPAVWGEGLNIAERKIVNTLQGDQLSIKELIRYSHEGKLFSGRKDNPFIRELINYKNYVLDSNDRVFEPVIKIIPGIIDLDMLFDIGVFREDGKQDKRVEELIRRVNKVISKAGKKGIACISAPNLSGEFSMDVDLSGIKNSSFFDKFGLTKKFIAINPAGFGINAIFSSTEELNIIDLYKLIKKIVDNSGFFADDPETVKRKVVEIIVKGGV